MTNLNQSNVQADIRLTTGTAYNYEGDWMALFDHDGIAAGTFNERLLLWINTTLGTSYTEINGAKAAFAAARNYDSWGSMEDIMVQQIQVDEFTTTGAHTWTKPTWAMRVHVRVFGGGGGGGSGRKGATNSARTGGTGASGSRPVEFTFAASDLTDQVTVTIGTGGTGGSAQTTNSTDGSDGTSGTATTFGAYLKAAGGLKGKKGINSAGSVAQQALGDISHGSTIAQNAAGSGALLPVSQIWSASGLGGEPGGTAASATTGNAELAGLYGLAPFGDPGLTDPAFNTGTNGTDGADSARAGIGGSSGAGGGFPGGRGGDAGRGAGGGGGAPGSDSAFDSGRGGNGGNGYACITSYRY